jgi:hypothetical protein
MIQHFMAVMLSAVVSGTPAEVPLPDGPVESLLDQGGAEMPMLPGCFIGWEAGLPDLPVWPAWIELEEGAVAVGVDVVIERWEDLTGVRMVRPLPFPAVPSLQAAVRNEVKPTSARLNPLLILQSHISQSQNRRVIRNTLLHPSLA